MKIEDFNRATDLRKGIDDAHNKSIKIARLKNRPDDKEFMDLKDMCLGLIDNYTQQLENKFDAL